MTIWTMGINQSTHGSDGVVAINNLNLITGNIGKPGGSSLSITGQCNAMGTREWSSCSGLPGYRALENEQDRKDIAGFWGIEEEFFPEKRGLFMTDILPAIESGQIKGLWLIATNPMTSMANTPRIRKTLEKLEFLCGAGCLRGCGKRPICPRLFPRQCVGRKGWLFYKHRTTRKSSDKCCKTARRFKAGFMDL